jgi:homoaconitase/3-isopropylmalate dehydratase large subunit
MSVAARMTMSNLSVELGAKFGICPGDEKLLNYLKPIVQQPLSTVNSDEDATYEKVHDIDVTNLEPQIACPHDLANVKPISEVRGTRIDQAFLGSCTNGRLEDLEVAARILKNKKVNKHVRFLVSPASWDVYRSALKAGIIQTLVEAGVIVCNPTCGPCFGALGSLASGERCIASSPRNFQGRMGSPEAEIYLGSPAVVAASALRGVIEDPNELEAV